MTAPQDGTWCHIEIPVADVEAGKKFYGEIFGWQFQDIPEMGYVLYTTKDGAEVGGGMMKREEGMPQQMVNYLCVDEIAPTLDRITNHGGKVVHPEMAVGNVGWMAWASDPDGNLFALWKSNPEGHQ
jgi:predicted enzyme related to lactoylglutathione lyase